MIAFQLYSARNFPYLDATLAMLAEAGYRAVEPFAGLYDDVGALRDALDRHGLAAPSGHMALETLEERPGEALRVSRTLGFGKVYAPWIAPDARPRDREGWEAFARRLHAAGAPVREAGMTFGWHNHDFEMRDLGGGVTALDVIAETGVALELDLAWVAKGGGDPVQWLRKLGGQVATVHVKDIAAQGENAAEDGWADVGHGIMDWEAIVAELRRQGIEHWVVEHDNPADAARFARRSLATLGGW